MDNRMTREELKAHCEKQIEMCEMWAISKGEKPSGKIYEEHKLILELLEQEPRKGHWIRVAGGSLIDDYRCDCCNHQPPIRKVGSTWGWDFTDYCPNCGADMREVEE